MPLFAVTLDNLRTRKLTGAERGHFLANRYPLSDHWDEAQDRRREDEKAEVEMYAKMRAELPPHRRIKAPFGDRTTTDIPADYPSWVGTPGVG